MSETRRIDARVHGRVQGVGFRWFVQRRAERLGLRGWVANEASGTVRVVAEGPAEGIDELLADLRTGPRGAIVDRVELSPTPPTGEFGAFEIRASGHGGD